MIITKFSGFVWSLVFGHISKLGPIRSSGFWFVWFKVRGRFAPYFQRPLHLNYTSDANVSWVQEWYEPPLLPYQLWCGSDFAIPRGSGLKFDVFCLQFRRVLEWQSLWSHFAISALEYGNDFDSVDMGRFVVEHPRLTSSLQRLAEPPQNTEIENTVQL